MLHSRNAFPPGVLGGLLVILLILAGCRGERSGEVAEVAMVAGGRASFQAYCASCHGREGRGDGPVATQLKVRPADLTTIAARREGVFPHDYILQTIDGRIELMAHGGRAMPVWGKIWRPDPSDPESEVEAERVLTELVHYLESIQE
jgi:mono/diheme cytochrome c family protein